MTKTPFEHVKDFYLAFAQELPEEDSEPSLINDLLQKRLELKMDLIFEEFQEIVHAVYGDAAATKLGSVWEETKALDNQNRDIVEAADGIADTVYVLMGLALEANIPFDAVFGEVQRSNMSKLDKAGNPLLSDGITPAVDGAIKPKGKILKGPDFSEPDIRTILFAKK
jgi:predicted HAD superfamily Cof-like phosphohydrolase